MKLENLVKNLGKKIKDASRNLNGQFYLKDAAVALGTVTGPLALYLSSQDAFINDHLNTISFWYGIGAISAVSNHYVGSFLRSCKKYQEVIRWVENNKDK